MIGGVKISHQEVDILNAEHLNGAVLDWQGDLAQGLASFSWDNPQKVELTGVRSLERPSSDKALAKRMLRALPPLMRTFVKCTLRMIVSSTRRKRHM